MVPKLSIRSYHRLAAPIRQPITKFGGQPVWLDEPTWPISSGWGTPMRFVCQIRLDPLLFGNGLAKMAYLFLTQAERDDIESGAFDPDIIFPDEGENAVILQPGGRCIVNTKASATGPTLYTFDGEPCELSCVLEGGDDPEYLERNRLAELARHDHERFESYCDTLAGDKVGGTPLFGNNDSWPANGPWQLLLQLLPKRSEADPFYLNLGATLATGFAFLSHEQGEGRFLVD